MSKENLEKFKLKCKAFLATIDIHRLRAYGRSIGVSRPAAKDKEELIEDIVGILSYELAPVERSNRGAPVKNDSVDERLPAKIAEIKAECFVNDVMMDIPEYDFNKEYQQMLKDTEGARWLVVNDPQIETVGSVSKVVSRGQVCYYENEWFLFSFSGAFSEEKVPIPAQVIEEYKLRDGDVVTCYYRETSTWKKVEVVTSINGVALPFVKERPNFDECNACYSKQRICFYDENKFSSATHKCVDWLFPITEGQRACVISTPKAGKTQMLHSLANAASNLNSNTNILVLLSDQTHETVSEFRRNFNSMELAYTTYEDDADHQVYVAECILNRAKRYAEMGKRVILFVDSLTALARAFNDTEASMGGKTLPCGLEVKTIHYLKKYFGAARCLEKGGSITIIGSLSVDTGNPMDDIVARELSELATLKIELSNELAIQRIYPAIDFEKSTGKYNEMVKAEEEMQAEILLKNNVLPRLGSVGVLNLLKESNSQKECNDKIKSLSANV